MLSTLPYLVLIGALAVLAIGIMIIAFPGAQPQPPAPGNAPAGRRGQGLVPGSAEAVPLTAHCCCRIRG